MSDYSILALLEMPEVELYSLLADSLSESERNMFPPPMQERLRLARRLVEQVLMDMRGNICAKKAIRDAVEMHDGFELVILISDVLAEGSHASRATLIAALLVRIGIRKICFDVWS